MEIALRWKMLAKNKFVLRTALGKLTDVENPTG
jgi:hypothetical protein